MTQLDLIKQRITTAPTQFDSEGYWGAYHPRKAETDQYSLWANLTTAERLFAVSFRQMGSEPAKCAGYFGEGACDLPMSHVCANNEFIHADRVRA